MTRICTDPKCGKETKLIYDEDSGKNLCSICGALQTDTDEKIDDNTQTVDGLFDSTDDIEYGERYEGDVKIDNVGATTYDGNFGDHTIIGKIGKDSSGRVLEEKTKDLFKRLENRRSRGQLTLKGKDKREQDNLSHQQFQIIYAKISPPQWIGSLQEPHPIEKRTRDLFYQIIDKNLLKGREKYLMFLSCFCIAARSAGNLLDSWLVSNQSDSRLQDLFNKIPDAKKIWVYYKLIVMELNVHVPPLETEPIIKKIIFEIKKTDDKLEFNSLKIFNRAEEIIKTAKEKGIGGQKAATWAATGVWIGLLENNVETTYLNWEEICDTIKFPTHPQSIRKLGKIINKELRLGLEI